MATVGTAGGAGGFEIGLVMAGAVSAGAYAAGVVDFLIQALDQWHEGKRGDDPRAPAMTFPQGPGGRLGRRYVGGHRRGPVCRCRSPADIRPEVASQCRLPPEDHCLRHAFCDCKSLRDNWYRTRLRAGWRATPMEHADGDPSRSRPPAPTASSACAARASTTSRTSTSTSRATRWSCSPASPARASRRWRSARSTPRRSGATSSRSRPYARRLFHQLGVPEVDEIDGLPPAVALQQQRGVADDALVGRQRHDALEPAADALLARRRLSAGPGDPLRRVVLAEHRRRGPAPSVTASAASTT